MCCPAHPDAPLVEDYHAGDMICPECGLVVGDRSVISCRKQGLPFPWALEVLDNWQKYLKDLEFDLNVAYICKDSLGSLSLHQLDQGLPLVRRLSVC